MNTCQNVVNVLLVQDVSFYTYLCLTDLFIEHPNIYSLQGH